jgi:citrate lyase subunit beta/citryl-CoA lyase
MIGGADRGDPGEDRHCIVQAHLPDLGTPSPEHVRRAAAVSALFAADPDAGVPTLDSKMLDRPHLKLAERILAATPLD